MGTGRVYSWIVNHHAFLPAMADEVPFAVLMVALDDADDLFMYGNLVAAGVEDLAPGLPVEAVFTDFAGNDRDGGDGGRGFTLVQWRPRRRTP
jgi:uncharacterized OB-fold protein